jgi:hypothetical protein
MFLSVLAMSDNFVKRTEKGAALGFCMPLINTYKNNYFIVVKAKEPVRRWMWRP